MSGCLSQKSLVSFAGANLVKNESGDSKPKSVKASKTGFLVSAQDVVRHHDRLSQNDRLSQKKAR